MKFLAAYDRALDEWEIFGQHAAQAPVHFSAYVTLTLSFALPGGTSFKTVNVTGFAAIFSVSCSGSRISMSSYYAGATNVTFNLSFIVAATVASVPFKTISVTGLRLLAFNSSTASPKCTNINSSSVVVTANLMMPSGTLLLHFSNAVKLNRGSNEITCSVFGFTNAGAAAATATMSVSTFDAEGLPFQTQLGVEGTDRCNSFRSNGVNRTTNGHCTVFDTLAISKGYNPEQTSDFAVQSKIVSARLQPQTY